MTEEVGHNKISRDAKHTLLYAPPQLRFIVRAIRSKYKVVISLQKGEKHSYTFPTFLVITAMLREVSNCFWAITAPGK